MYDIVPKYSMEINYVSSWHKNFFIVIVIVIVYVLTQTLLGIRLFLMGHGSEIIQRECAESQKRINPLIMDIHI